MIPEIDPELGLKSVAGLAGLWLFFKKFLVKNRTEDVALQAEGAHMDVIALMRGEIKRLSDSNKGLIETIENFIKITNELTRAVNSMENENNRLKLEVMHLNGALVDLKAKLESIRTRKTDVAFKSKQEDRRST